ncbi:peptide chain release factor N(5)-glutamine methyltransferase [Micromonospora carbonacea]|uniref:Release factor glutamine methyltransferase n=1 Tax=Micromonospora carbonacea TaxID=47853 RepID=A0A7H8XR79_9ACTN|nr:peptide chain release factor N(5)-glutamine methyltransferase [Micromonospora carbonacea]MBB5824602.1 release factor glutamine methyltransferase [Micromonospora carbonacea]QLD27220.1 peptide chain release factor N(5)-glutamine methyltransferase [Micromonospora carbonacea]
MTSRPQHPSEGSERLRPTVAVARAARVLAAAGIDAPRAEAELLAAHVLGVPRGRLALADGLAPDQLDRYDALVARRATREPLQHLTGTAAFRHLELAVGPGVFVPRPETELLAGWGVDQARLRSGGGGSSGPGGSAVPGGSAASGAAPAGAPATAGSPLVVDLCSGSGAIALAVAQETPAARVVAVERSPAALAWLRRNAADRAAAGDRPVEVVAADVTDPGLLGGLEGRVDVLLCNPPYVPRAVEVPPEVAAHDPDEAVFGGADGLDVIRPVLARAALLLRPGGVLGVEHDDTHGAAVPALLAADGRYEVVEEHRDLAGRPRFTTARRRLPAAAR